MSLTLARINARRAWYVPGVSIWGDLSALTLPALATEFDDTATRVVLYEFTLGGSVQEVPYSSMIDHRGNPLPPAISGPVVIPIPRNAMPGRRHRPTDRHLLPFRKNRRFPRGWPYRSVGYRGR